MLGVLGQDLRYAGRTLRKSPGFTAVAVLTLAIGIGANTAIFSVVNAVLLRPLPFHDPDSLCLLTERMAAIPVVGPSYQNYTDWRTQAQSFEGIAAAQNITTTLSGAGEPEQVIGQRASAGLFPLLGVSAAQGHTFTADEDRAGAAPVALITHGFWQRHFGGAPDVVGRSITLGNQPYTIVGILPSGYRLIQPVDVVIPFEPWAKKLPDDRSWHPGIIAVGRLKPGVTVEQARAELATIAKRLERQYPVTNTDVGADVNRMQDQLVQNVRPALLVLLGAVGLVLLIACANVANLLLARATARQREIAVRTAMGASQGRILRQLLTESVVLAATGGAFGLTLAWIAMQPLTRLAANSLPNVGPIGLDVRVLLFTAVVAVLSGILFGLAPAMQTARLDLRSVMNEAMRGSTGGAGQRSFRSMLVVLEVALALVLLVGAGLLLRSFERLQDVSPGFRADHLLVADVPVSPGAHPQAAERMALFDRLLERAAVLPGVKSVGAAASLPVSGGGPLLHFNIQGRPPKSGHDYILVGYRPVSAHYLETLNVPLVKGRLLTDADTERAPFAVVVNQSMERQFFPGESALGKRVQVGATPEKDVPWMEIVGVVGDMKQNLATDAKAEMYVPFRQANALLPVFAMSVVLRTANDPRTEVAALRQALREIDPNQPLVKVRTMEENIATSVSEPRFRTTLLGIFAASALLLAVVGLYGVMVYSVTQRVQEIGIRMTLGAQTGDVLRMVVRQGLTLVAIGVAIGLCGALLLSRVLAKFLYGVSATDPLTYAGVAALLIGVAALACYVPARRATRVDPMVALRYE